MKKLLLLAALPLLLVGCADNGLNLETKDFGWKEVKENEYIEVYYGNKNKTYYGNAENTLKYKITAYSSVIEVYVVQEITYTNDINDYYIGNNITVYHYEV